MIQPIASMIARFEPISLEGINQRASLQVRSDNKYFLRVPEFLEFLDQLRSTHVIMEINGTRAFSYDTQYFDTPTLQNYWSHVQNRRKRFKCRTRTYVDNGLTFFEIKMKGGRGETVKEKMAYSEAQMDMINPSAASFLEDRLRDFYGIAINEPMMPTLQNAYRRITLAARGSAERVTCDFDLFFGSNNQWHGRLADDYVLIETKSERGRSDADHLLWRLRARPTPGSKYCLGISLLHPHLRCNPFRQIRQSYFVREADPIFVREVDPVSEEQLLSVAVGATVQGSNDSNVAVVGPISAVPAVAAD